MAREMRAAGAVEADRRISVVGDGMATIQEAMAFLSIGRAKLYLLMESGELPYGKFGKCRRIPWRALRELAANAIVV